MGRNRKQIGHIDRELVSYVYCSTKECRGRGYLPHCMNLASVCHLPDSDTLRLSLQESRRNLNDLLAIVRDWKRRMSAEKFLEAVTALQNGRPCPEGFSLAKSPQEQAFTTKKVMILDRNHPYLPSHTRGTQADSGQVNSPTTGLSGFNLSRQRLCIIPGILSRPSC